MTDGDDIRNSSATCAINYNAVATPIFDTVSPGSYNGAQSVTLSSSTSGATIRYTPDGSVPTQSNGSTYAGAIVVAVGTTVTIKAYAYKAGMGDPGLLSGTFTSAAASPYAVSYDRNGSDGGSVQVDAGQYELGQIFTALGNSAGLTKGSLLFNGWNAMPGGKGAECTPGQSYVMGSGI